MFDQAIDQLLVDMVELLVGGNAHRTSCLVEWPIHEITWAIVWIRQSFLSIWYDMHVFRASDVSCERTEAVFVVLLLSQSSRSGATAYTNFLAISLVIIGPRSRPLVAPVPLRLFLRSEFQTCQGVN